MFAVCAFKGSPTLKKGKFGRGMAPPEITGEAFDRVFRGHPLNTSAASRQYPYVYLGERRPGSRDLSEAAGRAIPVQRGPDEPDDIGNRQQGDPELGLRQSRATHYGCHAC
jgi:hypothetical protein